MTKTPMNNTKELRAFLVDKMESVANNELDANQCKGIANLAQQIYNTLNIEIKMAKVRSDMPDGAITSVDFK